MTPPRSGAGPGTDSGPVVTRATTNELTDTQTVPQDTDETAQRLAERVERVRREREYRAEVRAYLAANRAAGKAIRHRRRLGGTG